MVQSVNADCMRSISILPVNGVSFSPTLYIVLPSKFRLMIPSAVSSVGSASIV